MMKITNYPSFKITFSDKMDDILSRITQNRRCIIICIIQI